MAMKKVTWGLTYFDQFTYANSEEPDEMQHWRHIISLHC